MLNLHVLGTIMVDAGRRAASETIPRTIDTEHGVVNVTGETMLNTLLNHWIKYYGIPNIIRNDPERAFHDQGFRRGLAARRIRLDNDLGDASWKTGVLSKTLDIIKQAVIRVARRTPDIVTIQEIFVECTAAHNVKLLLHVRPCTTLLSHGDAALQPRPTTSILPLHCCSQRLASKSRILSVAAAAGKDTVRQVDL